MLLPVLPPAQPDRCRVCSSPMSPSWSTSSLPSSSGAAKRASACYGPSAAAKPETTRAPSTNQLAALDERDHQIDQRMAELRDELAAVHRQTVSTAERPIMRLVIE